MERCWGGGRTETAVKRRAATRDAAAAGAAAAGELVLGPSR